MYLITYHGKPSPSADVEQDIGGAYINSYIHVDDFEEADKIARNEIRELGWDVLELEDAYEIDATSVSEAGRQYFEQALVDESVFVIHTYPARS